MNGINEQRRAFESTDPRHLFENCLVTEFHRIWIEQCEAAEGIKQQFGVNDAIRYLIGEKLLRFMQASHDQPEFSEQLPRFVTQIKRIFEPHEIVAFFHDLEAGMVIDPAQVFKGDKLDDDGIDEDDVLNEAERILLIENAKKLLQS